MTAPSTDGSVIAYVGLGANLGDREATLRRAVEMLACEAGIRVRAVSSFRETAPVGYAAQPWFVNAVAMLETVLPPRELLERLLAVEHELGRVREGTVRFGPRTCDLDLLLYGSESISEPDLVVPHPRLAERRFALEPLVELEPALRLPDGRRVVDLIAELEP